MADSHLNSYVRFRLALTEETPTIKAYDEAQWAELEDARCAPIEVSLALLESLHDRWVRLLRSLQPEDFARTLKHSERGLVSLDENLAKKYPYQRAYLPVNRKLDGTLTDW